MSFGHYFLGGLLIGRLGAFYLRPYIFPDASYVQNSLVLWLEGGTGLIFSFVFMRFGLCIESMTYSFLGFLLLFLSLVDFKKYIIPDNVLLLIFSLYSLNENFCFIVVDWINFSSLFFVGFFLKIGYFLAIKKNVLGWGDVKLFSLCGLWIERDLIPVFLLITGIGGVLLYFLWRYKSWGEYFPLGPSICLALWIVIIWF